MTAQFPTAEHAFTWLREQIAAVKAADPLAPATVLVANHYVGLVLRRRLAEAGYVNVRFTALGQVAEPLAAPRLAQRGYSPLSVPVQEAAIRAALAASGADLGRAAGHPSIATMLRRLFETLRARGCDEAELAALAGRGRVAEQSLAVYRSYLEILHGRRLYDARRLLDEALAELDERGEAALAGAGALFAHLLPPLREPERRLVEALQRTAGLQQSALAPNAARTTQPSARILRAPDAAEEVRWAVRQVLGRAEAGTRLDRMAIAYAASDPYAALVRETVSAAGIPWAGLDGRPLAGTRPGRVLLGALRLREREFARVDVLALLGALPHRALGHITVGQWDRLSRRAGVVKGAREWRSRLELLAADLEARAASRRDDEGGEEPAAGLEARARTARVMASRIRDLERQVRPPEERTWPALSKWALSILKTVTEGAEEWSDADRDALAMLAELVENLAGAGTVEAEVTVTTFVGALEAALTSRRQPEGRVGTGLLVGPLASLGGIPLDHLVVVGAGERALPTQPPADPVFPAAGPEDVLGLRAERLERERWQFDAALAAAPEPLLAFAAWDQDLRPGYPSPWVVEVASALEGAPLSAGWLRLPDARPWLHSVHSPESSLEAATVLLNPAEWLAAQARPWRECLLQSPLGRRPGPVRRNLEVRAARGSSRFTEFDGHVAAIAAQSARLRDGIAGSALSPSRIETWATCPYRHFLRNVVGVEPTERPEQNVAWGIDSLTRGSLVHAILQRFLAEQHERGRPQPGEAWGAPDHARMEEIAREEMAALEARGAVAASLAWENERAAVLADLHTALEKDLQLRDGRVPTWFEQDFGFDTPGSWPAPRIELGDGRAVELRGRIDRVDVAGETAIVIDYKTGRAEEQKTFDADPVDAGRHVQLAGYIAAVQAAHPQLTGAGARYWYLSTKGEFRVVGIAGAATERLASVLGVVDRGVRAGSFPQVPGEETARPGLTGWDNCLYCDFNRVCPTGRDQLWQRKSQDPAAGIHGELAGE